ncbi:MULTISPECIES: sensor histidine kinase [Bradyrhizobium]|jgi:signal transduction histidine kinase|uniref:histidine kinase n=2 Tax=Bradyrhizobium TaxID=374 RepID=A0ABY0PAK7_9BRAD|nr:MULTISPECIES: HAMP domain-containing sensor histidine kinase [Bradyrhizobium]SDH82732.1 signal transduction histidine kinase [Bradyrhizobium ottawaense]SEE03464.1 signal transduction histidine kinase [Bradyrhizobium lablabi]SHL99171.1 signal transduction histidine kinase [Bradyrhizobium lablabi]
MPSFKSTTSRIVFLHIVAIALTAIFMPLVLFWLLTEETNALHQRAMIDQAATVSRYLSLASDGSWSYTPPPGLKAQFSEAYGRYIFDVVDRSGRVLVSSADDETPLFAVSGGEKDRVYREVRRGDSTIAGVSVEHTIGGRPVMIQVGEDLSHRDVLTDDIVANFFRRVGWITLPILMLLLAADIVIFRRAVRPLLDASRAARDIGPTRTDVRIPSATIPSEIRPLVDAVNQALDRLEQGYHVQREFTADAAHELRTPLAILRARLDQLEDSKVSRDLKADIRSMGRVVSQLLDAAELDSTFIGPNERADLSALCSDVVEMLAPLALESQRTIELTGAEAHIWVHGNAEMLRGAVRNLVENALRHTPPRTVVEVHATAGGAVSVIDQGPGVVQAERALIFQRFWRRDRSRPGSAGLGLSIVQRIVEAHGGTITVSDNPGGGAIFTIQLELSDDPGIAAKKGASTDI